MKNKRMQALLKKWNGWKVQEHRIDLGASWLTTNNFTLLIICTVAVSLLILLVGF